MFVNKIPKQNHIIFLILNFKFYLFLCLIFFTACSEKNDNNKQVDANGLLSVVGSLTGFSTIFVILTMSE